MSNLKVLLIQSNPDEGGRIAAALEQAQHFVMPAVSFEEASEALLVQHWDAVLLSPPIIWDGLDRFAFQLRQLGSEDRTSGKTPLLSVHTRTCAPSGAFADQSAALDVILPEPFEADAFAEAVATLADQLGARNQSTAENTSGLPIFNAEEFREQLAFDNELIVEIIDLFLEERTTQMNDMSAALESGDFNLLSRAAHTIKGSFGSLHAERARVDASELELAAKNGDSQNCETLLLALEQDLDELIPLLLTLRDA